MTIENNFLCIKSNRPFFTPGKVYQGKKDTRDSHSYHVYCNNGYKFYLNGDNGTEIVAFENVIAEFEQVTDAEFEEVKDENKISASSTGLLITTATRLIYTSSAIACLLMARLKVGVGRILG